MFVYDFLATLDKAFIRLESFMEAEILLKALS